MSPKRKDRSFPPVKVTEELLNETKVFAEDCDEYLSDYIRKAVQMRNAKYRADVDIGNKAISQTNIDNAIKLREHIYKDVPNIEGLTDNHKNYTDSCKAKETYKQEVKSKMVQPLMKGGK